MEINYRTCHLALQCLSRILINTSQDFSELKLSPARDRLIQRYGYTSWSDAIPKLKTATPGTLRSLFWQLRSEILQKDSSLVRTNGKYFQVRLTDKVECRTTWRGHVHSGHELREPWTFTLSPETLTSFRKNTDSNTYLINSSDMFNLWFELGSGTAMIHENIAREFLPDLLGKADLGLASDTFDREVAKSQGEFFEDNYVRYEDIHLILSGRAISY